MCRLVPWALLGLLVVGAAVGAVVGQASAPHASTVSPVSPAAPAAPAAPASAPAQWVRDVLAATARAGSARFTYLQVTDSANPVLRNANAGSGAVDFTTGAVRATEVERQGVASASGLFVPHTTAAAPVGNAVETIAIGQAVYQDLGGRWMKLPLPRDPHIELGLQLAANASVALAGIEGVDTVVGVRTLGPAKVGNVAATRYQVTSALPRPCNAQQAAATAGDSIGPTTLWVDGSGRLVQASLTSRVDFRFPKSLRGKFPSAVPSGPAVTTATLRLTDFGAPVHITPPATVQPPYPGSTGFAIARSCHS